MFLYLEYTTPSPSDLQPHHHDKTSAAAGGQTIVDDEQVVSIPVYREGHKVPWLFFYGLLFWQT